MAQIRLSFSTALFALSFVICLIVALLFVDRSRQEADENGGANGKNAALGPVQNRENTLLSTSAMSSTAFEHPPTQTTAAVEAPKLVLSSVATAGTPAQFAAGQPATPAATAELPIDSRLTQPQQPAPAAVTPALNPAQLAALSPEALARQLQGRVTMPNSVAKSVPPMAVPPGMPYAKPSPTPIINAAISVTRTPLPIVTNGDGLSGGMKQLGYSSPYGASGGLTVESKDASLPFSHAGAVSTDRLRAALATNANLDPQTLLPVEPAAPSNSVALTNAPNGWQPTQASAPEALPPTPTPNSRIVIRGQDRPSLVKPADTASLIAAAGVTAAQLSPVASTALPPAPSGGVDPLAGVVTNEPAVPSPTPNYATGFGNSPTAAAATGGKWNLPPAPSLPGAAIHPEQANPAPGSASKVTLLPIDDLPAKPLSSNAGNPASSSTSLPDAKTGISDLPLDVAARTGMLENTVAAKVNDRSLTGGDAARRAEALAALDGRKLDADGKRMMSRTAAETWADMVSLAEEAKRQGISITDNEVKQILAANPSLKGDDWERAMKKAGFTDAEAQADLRDIAMGEKLVQNAINRSYDETKLRALYEKDPTKFQPSRRFHVQEIFKTRPTDPATATSVERDLSKLQRQAASGADFGLLAMQAGDGPTKSNGGDIGWIDDRTNISEQMAQALLPLKPGQVSNLVSDSRGFHIYKLVDLQEPKQGFDGARDLVQSSLHNAVFRSMIDTADAHNKIDLAHRQKNARSAAYDKNSGEPAAALSKVFPPKGDRLVNDENGRVKVRSRRSRSGDTAAASRASSPGVQVPAMPAQSDITMSAGTADNKPVDSPPGFGTPTDADNSIPSTPMPATASATGGRLKSSFTNLLNKFHRPTPAQQ